MPSDISINTPADQSTVQADFTLGYDWDTDETADGYRARYTDSAHLLPTGGGVNQMDLPSASGSEAFYPSATGSGTTTITLTLYKVNGGVETSLASDQVQVEIV